MIHWQYHACLASLILAAAMSFAMAIFVWRRRPAPGATALAWLLLGLTWWSAGYAKELASTGLSAKLLWNAVAYGGVVTVPTAWFALVLQYTGRVRRLSPRIVALLSIEPLATLLLAWTNDSHGLFYSRTALGTAGALSVLNPTYGVWFWVNVVYCYLLVVLGTAVCVHALRHSAGPYRKQLGVLLVGAFIPWMAEALSVSGLSPLHPLDLTPFAFTLSGLVTLWGLFRFRLLDLAPVARGAVVNGMNDAVIVLDGQNRMVDLNPAAEAIIRLSASEVVGHQVGRVLSGQGNGLEELRAALHQGAHRTGEFCEEIMLGEDEARRTYDLRVSPLRDRRGRFMARLAVLHDITERKRAEEGLRQYAAQLQALRQVGLDIAAELDLDRLLQPIVSQAIDLLGGTSGGLYLYRPERDVLEWAVSVGPNLAPVGSVLQTGEGLSGRVWQTGQALTLDDYEHWDGRAAIYEGYSWTAVVGVPVRWGPADAKGEFLGVLDILTDAPRTFSPADAELLSLFANQAAIAIKNARLYEEAKEYSAKLAALYRTGKDITSILELDGLLHLIAERAASLTGADKSLILLVDTKSRKLISALGHGYAAGQIEDFTYQEVEDGISGWVLAQRTPTLSEDILADPRNRGVALQRARREQARGLSIAVAPMLIKGEFIGTLTVVNNAGKPVFDQSDLDLVVMLAGQAAIAIQNAWLYEEVEQRAAELRTAYEQLQRTQEALVRSERLAAMNQVAVTMRHEINNPLTAVLGNSDWLLGSDQTLSTKTRTVVEEIHRAAIRIRDVVRRLDDLEDRPVCYLGDTMMIDIRSDRQEHTPQPDRPYPLRHRCTPDD
jgi:PAS domain S-box-containing protein